MSLKLPWLANAHAYMLAEGLELGAAELVAMFHTGDTPDPCSKLRMAAQRGYFARSKAPALGPKGGQQRNLYKALPAVPKALGRPQKPRPPKPRALVIPVLVPPKVKLEAVKRKPAGRPAQVRRFSYHEVLILSHHNDTPPVMRRVVSVWDYAGRLAA
jgi:hypothetical protein